MILDIYNGKLKQEYEEAYPMALNKISSKASPNGLTNRKYLSTVVCCGQN